MCAARAASSTTRSASFAEDLISYIQTAMNQRPLVVHYNGIVLSQIAESDRMAQTLVLRVSIVFTETIVIPYRSNVASEARTPNIMFTGIRKKRILLETRQETSPTEGCALQCDRRSEALEEAALSPVCSCLRRVERDRSSSGRCTGVRRRRRSTSWPDEHCISSCSMRSL